MPYITLSSNDLNNNYDFIVVGAGSAGCPLASRLSEDLNATVLLIEAGPRDHGLEETIHCAVPLAAGKIQHTTMDWEYYAQPQAPHACTHLNTFKGAVEGRAQRSFWPRGKGMGGSSLINYMAWVRGVPNDYNEWESKYKCPGWGWASLKPLFEERIENIAECDPSQLCSKCRVKETSNGPYGISHKKPTCGLASQFLEACQELGHEKGDYNCGCNKKATKGVVGLHQTSVKQGTRCTASRAYIDPLMTSNNNRPNLTVLSGARCTRIVTETKDGKVVAKGVELVPDQDASNSTAQTTTVQCGKEVVLSAGALGSPQILLQSGIGPNGSTFNAPLVGQNLLDHLVCVLRFPPKLGQGNQDIGSVNGHKAEGWKTALGHLWDCFMNHRGVLTSSAYDASLFYSSKPPGGLFRPNLQLSCMVSPTDQDFMQGCFGLDFDAYDLPEAEMKNTAEGLVFCCTLLHPQSKGCVTVNEQNELVIEANYLTDAAGEDLKAMVVCLRKAIEIANTKTYQSVIKGAPFWPKDLCRQFNLPCHDEDTVPAAEDYPDAFFEAIIRRYATTLYHPTTTCRMGTSTKEAVVDPTLKVFGVANLRVADASIQPTIVSGNTQASCVLIGEKAADIIREEYSLKGNPKDLLDAVGIYEADVQKKRRWIAGGLFATAAAVAVGVSMVAVRARNIM